MDQTLHQPDEMAGYLGFLMHRKRAESSGALLQHFGFLEDPFRVSPDARYMFPSKTHLEALASLEQGFYNDRGFIAMIAPPGMGKTTLLYRFLEDTQATARAVFLFDIDPECEPRDFVGYILRDFGITPARSRSEMHNQLGEALIRETEEGRKCVVVIDEAQNLSDAVLERVRLLTNFETSKGKLLQIILSGQPQLSDKLLHASLVQLRQRVSTVCRLELLTEEETINYIDYRLMQAGYSGEPLFTEDALKLIAETANGTPRTINNLCYNSLALCSQQDARQVDSEMVAKVAANLQLVSQSGALIAAGDDAAEIASGNQQRKFWGGIKSTQVKLWVPATLAVLLLCVLGVFRLGGVGTSQPRTFVDNRPLVLPPAPASVSSAKNRKAATVKAGSNAKPTDPLHGAGKGVSNPPNAAAAKPSRTEVVSANREVAQLSAASALQGGSLAGDPPPAQASVSIDSSPSGADIEIDGAFVGNTPSTVSIAPGSHRITVNKKGFTGWGRTLSVSSGTVHLNAELEQEPPKQ
jgi:type II secretory pathway predicted ATPase ExeA